MGGIEDGNGGGDNKKPGDISPSTIKSMPSFVESEDEKTTFETEITEVLTDVFPSDETLAKVFSTYGTGFDFGGKGEEGEENDDEGDEYNFTKEIEFSPTLDINLNDIVSAADDQLENLTLKVCINEGRFVNIEQFHYAFVRNYKIILEKNLGLEEMYDKVFMPLEQVIQELDNNEDLNSFYNNITNFSKQITILSHFILELEGVKISRDAKWEEIINKGFARYINPSKQRSNEELLKIISALKAYKNFILYKLSENIKALKAKLFKTRDPEKRIEEIVQISMENYETYYSSNNKLDPKFIYKIHHTDLYNYDERVQFLKESIKGHARFLLVTFNSMNVDDIRNMVRNTFNKSLDKANEKRKMLLLSARNANPEQLVEINNMLEEIQKLESSVDFDSEFGNFLIEFHKETQNRKNKQLTKVASFVGIKRPTWSGDTVKTMNIPLVSGVVSSDSASVHEDVTRKSGDVVKAVALNSEVDPEGATAVTVGAVKNVVDPEGITAVAEDVVKINNTVDPKGITAVSKDLTYGHQVVDNKIPSIIVYNNLPKREKPKLKWYQRIPRSVKALVAVIGIIGVSYGIVKLGTNNKSTSLDSFANNETKELEKETLNIDSNDQNVDNNDLTVKENGYFAGLYGKLKSGASTVKKTVGSVFGKLSNFIKKQKKVQVLAEDTSVNENSNDSFDFSNDTSINESNTKNENDYDLWKNPEMPEDQEVQVGDNVNNLVLDWTEKSNLNKSEMGKDILKKYPELIVYNMAVFSDADLMRRGVIKSPKLSYSLRLMHNDTIAMGNTSAARFLSFLELDFDNLSGQDKESYAYELKIVEILEKKYDVKIHDAVDLYKLIKKNRYERKGRKLVDLEDIDVNAESHVVSFDGENLKVSVDTKGGEDGNHNGQIPSKTTTPNIFSEINESQISEYVDEAFDGIGTNNVFPEGFSDDEINDLFAQTGADNVFPGLNDEEVDVAFDSIVRPSDAEMEVLIPIEVDDVIRENIIASREMFKKVA